MSADPLSDSIRYGTQWGVTALSNTRIASRGVLAPRDVRGHRVAGVVVDELDNHTRATTGQHVLGASSCQHAFGAG
jgi:hypothetical protein